MSYKERFHAVFIAFIITSAAVHVAGLFLFGHDAPWYNLHFLNWIAALVWFSLAVTFTLAIYLSVSRWHYELGENPIIENKAVSYTIESLQYCKKDASIKDLPQKISRKIRRHAVMRVRLMGYSQIKLADILDPFPSTKFGDYTRVITVYLME